MLLHAKYEKHVALFKQLQAAILDMEHQINTVKTTQKEIKTIVKELNNE